jgi:hypothetical protein
VKMVMVLYPGNGHKAEFGELEGQPVPGSAEGEIGLRRWLEDEGHELITTTDREGGGDRAARRHTTQALRREDVLLQAHAALERRGGAQSRFRYTRLGDMMKHCDIIIADSVETIRVIIASTNLSLPVRTGSVLRVWTRMRSGREGII